MSMSSARWRKLARTLFVPMSKFCSMATVAMRGIVRPMTVAAGFAGPVPMRIWRRRIGALGRRKPITLQVWE